MIADEWGSHETGRSDESARDAGHAGRGDAGTRRLTTESGRRGTARTAGPAQAAQGRAPQAGQTAGPATREPGRRLVPRERRGVPRLLLAGGDRGPAGGAPLLFGRGGPGRVDETRRGGPGGGGRG